jgi:hypothetical protein
MEVTSGMLEAALRTDPMVPQAARGGKFFEIDGGDKKIDAVQLTMGTGTIKVPVIQWTIESTFDPQDLQLDFTATLTDGDSDPDTDPSSVFLSETTT